MSIQPQLLTHATGLTLNSTGGSLELTLANQSLENIVIAKVASAASLVGGWIKAEIQTDDGTWITAPQEVSLASSDASSGSGPDVIAENTASAEAIVGSSVRNASGITNLTDDATIIFRIGNYGRPTRMSYDATSGTAGLSFEHTGLLAIA